MSHCIVLAGLELTDLSAFVSLVLQLQTVYVPPYLATEVFLLKRVIKAEFQYSNPERQNFLKIISSTYVPETP